MKTRLIHSVYNINEAAYSYGTMQCNDSGLDLVSFLVLCIVLDFK